ncbi:MAG: type II secretion system protein [Bacillota bacterium]|uniref:type II secretion system protein n=1 Tax=Rossellomorea sp. FM04394 TaxID=3243076 RepID=UPI0035A688F1
MIHNERGLTLVEVLATLTILSIIGAVVWNVFFQGIHYTKKAVSQNSIQQEANILTMKLTRIHQTVNEYELESSDCEIEVIYEDKPKEKFRSDQMCFSLVVKNSTDEDTSKHISLTVSDKVHSKNEIVLDTVLYRLEGN